MTVEQFRAYMRGLLAFTCLLSFVVLAILGVGNEAIAVLGTLTGMAFAFYYRKDEG